MTTPNTDDLRVENNEAASRFEVRLGDDIATLAYEKRGGIIILVHTGVPDAFAGKGVGGKLAQAGLNYARDNGLKAVPLCPFVAAYVNRHPEYEDSVLRPNLNP
jgi:predicted GNAT family acetyltransferase